MRLAFTHGVMQSVLVRTSMVLSPVRDAARQARMQFGKGSLWSIYPERKTIPIRVY